jgi:hypothetical protein
VVDPGAQGDWMTGMHGCGVSTPFAADVACETCGLERLWHIPKDGMLVVGLKSDTVPTAWPPAVVGRGVGMNFG